MIRENRLRGGLSCHQQCDVRLKNAPPNSFSAEALVWTQLGSHGAPLPRTLVGWGKEYPSLFSTSFARPEPPETQRHFNYVCSLIIVLHALICLKEKYF